MNVGGFTRSCNFASGKYGYETAKRLAIVAKHEGDRLGYFPSRCLILDLYNDVFIKQLHNNIQNVKKTVSTNCLVI